VSSPGLVELIHWLEDVFDGIGARRSYGGAIAYNYHGPPRLTLDVDVLVLVPDSRIPALLEELRSEGCLHGDADPRPIEIGAVLADLRSPAPLVTFRCRGIRIEIFAPWHPFHHRVLDRSPRRDLAGREIRIHAAEDLIVFKKIFDRPKDLMDIKAMLMARRGELDLARIRNEAAQLLDEESETELESLIREYA